MTLVDIYNSDQDYNSDQTYNPFLPSVSTSDVPGPYAVVHLAVPLTLAPDGAFQTWLQDSADEITQSVEVICGSVQGERTVVPTFGLPMTDFLTPTPGAILTAIDKWETRASVTVTVNPSATGLPTVDVGVTPIKGAT